MELFYKSELFQQAMNYNPLFYHYIILFEAKQFETTIYSDYKLLKSEYII